MTYPKLWPVGGHPEGEAKVRQLKKLSPKWLRASGIGWVAEKQNTLSNVKYGGGGGMYSASFESWNDGSPKSMKVWIAQKERGFIDHKEALRLSFLAGETQYYDSLVVLCDGVGRVYCLDNASSADGGVLRKTRFGGKWTSEDTLWLPAGGIPIRKNGALGILASSGAILYMAFASSGWVGIEDYNHPLKSRVQKFYARPLRAYVFSPDVWVICCSEGGIDGLGSYPKFYRTEDGGLSWSLVSGTDALFSPADLNRYNATASIQDTVPTEGSIVQVIPVSATKAVVVVKGDLSPAQDRMTLFDFATGSVVKQEILTGGPGQALFGHSLEVVALIGSGSWVIRRWTGETFDRGDGWTDYRYIPTYALVTGFWVSEQPIDRPPAESDFFYLGDAYGEPYGPNLIPFSAWYRSGAWLYVVMDGKRRELWKATGESLETHRRLCVLSEPRVRPEGGMNTNGIAYDGWYLTRYTGEWQRELVSVQRTGAPNAPAPLGNYYPWRLDARFAAPAWWFES